jgi:hypothetical protein
MPRTCVRQVERRRYVVSIVQHCARVVNGEELVIVRPIVKTGCLDDVV